MLFGNDDRVIAFPDRVGQHVRANGGDICVEDLAWIVRPGVHDLMRRFDRHDRDRGLAGGNSAFDRERKPRAVFLVFCETKRKFARVPQRRAIELPGLAAEHVGQEQADRAADAGVGAIAVGEYIVRRIHADSGAHRAVHHDHGSAAPGACGAAVQAELLIAHRADDRDNDRHVFGQAARHHRRDRNFFRGNAPAAHGFHSDDGVGKQRGSAEKGTNRGFRRRNDRQSVGPAVALIKLVGLKRVGNIENLARQTRLCAH